MANPFHEAVRIESHLGLGNRNWCRRCLELRQHAVKFGESVWLRARSGVRNANHLHPEWQPLLMEKARHAKDTRQIVNGWIAAEGRPEGLLKVRELFKRAV